MGNSSTNRSSGRGRNINIWPTRAQLARIDQELQAERNRPIHNWLKNNQSRHSFTSAKGLGILIRRDVSEVAGMSDVVLHRIIKEWGKDKKVSILTVSLFPVPGEHAPGNTRQGRVSSSQLIQRLKKLSKLDPNVTIQVENGRVKIGASGLLIEGGQRGNRASLHVNQSGASEEIKIGDGSISMSAGWDGSLGIKTAYQDISFAASITKDRWQMQLSLFEGAFPLPANLGNVFQKGHEGIVSLANELSPFPSLRNVSDLGERVSKHMKATKEAIQAAQRIAQHNPRRIHFGVTATAGADRGAGNRVDWGIQATITVPF